MQADRVAATMSRTAYPPRSHSARRFAADLSGEGNRVARPSSAFSVGEVDFQ
jgi:hypothetical protein